MTMKTNDRELRELDCWIEEHLFNRCRVEKSTHYVWPSREEVEAIKSEYPQAVAINYEPARFFSTDPAAAMMVLEKCAEAFGDEDSIEIGYGPTLSQPWCVSRTMETQPNAIDVGITLPLAICRFARTLFEKGMK